MRLLFYWKNYKLYCWLVKLEKIRTSCSAIVEMNFCFVWLQPISTIQPIQSRGSFIQFDKCEKSHFSFFLSRISPIVANKQISNLFPHFSFSTILKSKRRKKTKQVQNMLCKCGWDFDHFDQFDQNHAFSNNNPKRMTIGFVLRELLTIIKHCKNEKQNEWSWNFISFLVWFHHCRKEKIVKFIFILQQTTSIHSHSFNIIKPITAITIKPRWEWEEEKVKMNIINNHRTSRKPHRLTRAWREGKQTTLPQLPAFPAFCKCNEHPITSNAHWYPSGHSCRPRSVPLMF